MTDKKYLQSFEFLVEYNHVRSLIVFSAPYIGKAACKAIKLSGKGSRALGKKINNIGERQLAKRDFINGVKKTSKEPEYIHQNLDGKLDGWVKISLPA